MLVQQKIKNLGKIKNSLFLFLGTFFFVLAILFSFYPTNVFFAKQLHQVKGVTITKPTAIPTETITPTPYITYQTFTVSVTPQPTTATTQTTTTTTTTSSQAQQNSITLQISEPDGSSSNNITLIGDQTPCSILSEAKNEGKIKSVTIKNYPSLNSDYVQELNGYQNNWTFSLNGTSEPMGCSNYHLENGNTVSWKYN